MAATYQMPDQTKLLPRGHPYTVRRTYRLRSGLIVQADLTQADGHAERRAVIDMFHRHSLGSTRRITLGADRGYDSADFVTELRQMVVTPYAAQKSRYLAIDGRTARHPGYAKAQKCRKKIEEPFGWAKTIGGMRRPCIAVSNVCRLGSP